MPRRSKKQPSLRVRVSHEATRHSPACIAAAFECLVPTRERQVGRQPGGSRDCLADATYRPSLPMRRQ